MLPSATLSALGYLCLAAGLIQRVREDTPAGGGRGLTPTTTPGAVFGRARPVGSFAGDFGSVFSAAQARSDSPLFRQPAKATIYKNDNTIGQRAQRIRDLIQKGSRDPSVRKLAISVLSKRAPNKPGGWAVPEKDWKGEAEALFYAVRKNVRYTKDHRDADTYVHPARTLFDVVPGSGGGGDCDDAVITLGALLLAVGHDPHMVIGAIKQNGDETPGFNHIWLRNKLPAGGAISSDGGEWFSLDASVDRPPGWEAPKDRIYKLKVYKV